jgi:hypothetical protein
MEIPHFVRNDSKICILGGKGEKWLRHFSPFPPILTINIVIPNKVRNLCK